MVLYSNWIKNGLKSRQMSMSPVFQIFCPLFRFHVYFSVKRRFQFSMKTTLNSQSQDLGMMSTGTKTSLRPPLQKSMTISTASNHREVHSSTNSSIHNSNNDVGQVWTCLNFVDILFCWLTVDMFFLKQNLCVGSNTFFAQQVNPVKNSTL